MNTIKNIFLAGLVMLALTASGQGTIQRGPVTSSALSRQLFVLEGADQWKAALGLINQTNLGTFTSTNFFGTNYYGGSFIGGTYFGNGSGLTNVVWAMPATNGNALNPTISNLTVVGSFIYTNTATTSNTFRLLTVGNNPPASQMPLIGQAITGGNLNYLDTINIGFAYDLTNNYGDIVWGNFNSGNINSSYPQYNQEFEMGMSSVGGNWNYPFPGGQSNYGVYDGAWNGKNSLVLECDGGNPFIIAGDPTEGGIIPQFILSRDYHHILVTDRRTGQTNYFDMNKSNAWFYVPYGGIASPSAQFTGGTFTITNATNFQIINSASNPVAATVPLIGQAIRGGNTNVLDALIIGCAYDLPGNYGDIVFGNYNSGNIGTTYPAFNSQCAMGICSTNGNWNYPFINQSNYGVFDGAWNGKNCFVINPQGGNPLIIAGNTSAGEVPEVFLSRNYEHFFITDQISGRTNYFDFNKTNANFYVPYGTVNAGGGFSSSATNTFTMTSTGFTNTGSNMVRIFTFTNTTAYWSNITSGVNNKLTTNTPFLILQTNECVVGTACSASNVVTF